MGLAAEQASWGVGVGVLNMIQKHNFELQVLKPWLPETEKTYSGRMTIFMFYFLDFFQEYPLLAVIKNKISN